MWEDAYLSIEKPEAQEVPGQMAPFAVWETFGLSQQWQI